jgi:hypothetical protein
MLGLIGQEGPQMARANLGQRRDALIAQERGQGRAQNPLIRLPGQLGQAWSMVCWRSSEPRMNSGRVPFAAALLIDLYVYAGAGSRLITVSGGHRAKAHALSKE